MLLAYLREHVSICGAKAKSGLNVFIVDDIPDFRKVLANSLIREDILFQNFSEAMRQLILLGLPPF